MDNNSVVCFQKLDFHLLEKPKTTQNGRFVLVCLTRRSQATCILCLDSVRLTLAAHLFPSCVQLRDCFFWQGMVNHSLHIQELTSAGIIIRCLPRLPALIVKAKTVPWLREDVTQIMKANSPPLGRAIITRRRSFSVSPRTLALVPASGTTAKATLIGCKAVAVPCIDLRNYTGPLCTLRGC